MEKFLESEPLKSQVKGTCILNLTTFVKLPPVGFVPAYAHTSQV